MNLTSCDTFVCFPPLTLNGLIGFGKNSDRPAGEVQEIIYQPKCKHEKGTKLKCTYIEIDQVPETEAVILSKPSWMWGAEMGSNEHGLCIGNEAVWTKSDYDLNKKRLLGMDLVRLGLERGKSAMEALNVITNLLSTYGQGGPCSETMDGFTYHNSFLIVDKSEAWVLETAGLFWAAEKISSGYRHISNELSIGTKIDLMSPGLKEAAKSLGLWNSSVEFNFSEVFSSSGEIAGESERIIGGRKLMEKHTRGKSFDFKSMMTILRDEASGICRACDDSFPSTSSQVSILTPDGVGLSRPDCHWFTGTPNPKHSIFKPFVFCNNVKFSEDTASPIYPDGDGGERFDRAHRLYKAHDLAVRGKNKSKLTKLMEKLEFSLTNKVDNILRGVDNSSASDGGVSLELYTMFKDSVDAELKLYE